MTVPSNYGNCFSPVEKTGFQLRFILLSVNISGNLETLVQLFCKDTTSQIASSFLPLNFFMSSAAAQPL